VFALAPDRSVQASFDCDESFEGYPGIVNGGTVSSLLDGAMANCLFLHGKVAVTGELNVRFVRPVITNRRAQVRAWIARPSPPYHVLKAQVIQGQQVKAWAIGKFVNQTHLAAK
jgi:acyl-coenzyme A thioesterase PaaI-like protein